MLFMYLFPFFSVSNTHSKMICDRDRDSGLILIIPILVCVCLWVYECRYIWLSQFNVRISKPVNERTVNSLAPFKYPYRVDKTHVGNSNNKKTEGKKTTQRHSKLVFKVVLIPNTRSCHKLTNTPCVVFVLPRTVIFWFGSVLFDFGRADVNVSFDAVGLTIIIFVDSFFFEHGTILSVPLFFLSIARRLHFFKCIQ